MTELTIVYNGGSEVIEPNGLVEEFLTEDESIIRVWSEPDGTGTYTDYPGGTVVQVIP